MTPPPPRPGRKALFLDLPPEEQPPREPVSHDATPPAIPAVPEAIIRWFRGVASGEWNAPPPADSLPAEYGPLSDHLARFWTVMNETREREKTLLAAFSHIPYPAAVLDNTGSFLTQSQRYRELAPTPVQGTTGIPERIHLDDKTRTLLFDSREVVSETLSLPGEEGTGGRSGSMIRRLIPFTPSSGETAYALMVLYEGETETGAESGTTEPASPAYVEEQVTRAVAAAREEMLQETTRLAGELAATRSALDRLSPLPEVLLASILSSFPVPAFRITKAGSISASNEHASPTIVSVPKEGFGGLDLQSLPIDTGTCNALLAASREGTGTMVSGEIMKGGVRIPCTAVLFPLPSTRDGDAGDLILLVVTGDDRTGTPVDMANLTTAIPVQESSQEAGTEQERGETIKETIPPPDAEEYMGEPATMESLQEIPEIETPPAGVSVISETGSGISQADVSLEGPEELEESITGESHVEESHVTPAPVFSEEVVGQEGGGTMNGGGGDGVQATPTIEPAARPASTTDETGIPEAPPGEGAPPRKTEEETEPAGKGENMADMTFDIVQFELAGEEYALDIRFSREIVEMMSITPIPRSPPHIAGVMNLRGEITTIINIYHLLGLEEESDYSGKKIIVLSPETAGGENVGIIVDDVRSVLQIRGSDVEFFKGADQSGSRVRMRGIIKLGTANASDRRPGSEDEKKLVIWVDIQQIIEEMMEYVQAAGS